ncbi:MAG: bacterial Ig-like domain-containing protein [Oscillospiraceae bacterium]|nr:bacterial Ig-like domain-containing protein [Oscillospiraceae bacterium]
MRTIKQILILALVALLAGHVVTAIYKGSSDRTIGPTIECAETTLEVRASDSESALMEGITAYDPQDGDLTQKVIVASVSKLVSNNTAKVTYLVFDSDDNMATYIRRIRYIDYMKPYFSIDPTTPLIYPSTAENVQVVDRITAHDVVDGDLTHRVRVSTLSPTEDAEVYDITLQVTNSLGDTSWVKLPVQFLPTDPLRPTITLKEYLVYAELNSTFDPMDYLSSATLPDGTALAPEDVTVTGSVDTSTVDTYRITFSYNHGGSVGKAILTVVVV